MAGVWWSVPPEWPGQTVFIVGGGPSVLTQNLELLRGQKTIAINSSYLRVPFADVLIYDAGGPWWLAHKKDVGAFVGRIVAPSRAAPKVCPRRLFVHKVRPPGLSTDPSSVAMQNTTFSGAINYAVHTAAKRIVLLGADGRMGVDENGKPRSHHYPKHSWWTFSATRWAKHHTELSRLVAPLKQLHIEVVNCSPGSAWNLWPIANRLEDCLP